MKAGKQRKTAGDRWRRRAALAGLVGVSACSGSQAEDTPTGTGGQAGSAGTGGVGAAGGTSGGVGGSAAFAGAAAGSAAAGGAPRGGAGGATVSAGVGAVPTAGIAGGGGDGSGAGSGAAAGDGGAPAGGMAGSSTEGGTVGTAGSAVPGGAGNASGGGAQGGTSGASAGKGGAAGGGSAGKGGSAGGGGTGGANPTCPGADPAELAVVRGWLNNTTATGALPNYAYTNIQTNFPVGTAFDTLACSIAMSCLEFAPMESGWLRKCEAVITSAIVAESSYNPASVVVDSYATRDVNGTAANDPTIGLLQIRFSSTVHDYNYYGPMPKMAAIGCTWPSALTSQADNAAFWATAGGTTYLSFMQGVACNVGLATWYYFYNATSNGGASAVWISDYCGGSGTAGTMVIGLISHLQGGNFARPADASNAYPWGIECCACGNPSICSCTGCTGRVASFLGIGTSSSRPSPDPFLESLAPERSKYCR